MPNKKETVGVEIEETKAVKAQKAPKAKKSPKVAKIKLDPAAEMAGVCKDCPTDDDILKENEGIGDEDLEDFEGDAKFEGVDETGKVEETIVEDVATEEEVEGENRGWTPKTKLGRQVKAGEIGVDQIFEIGQSIREPQIIDLLFPNLQETMMLIGGSPGKGGGIQRRPSRRTVRVHKSGRRTNISMMTIVGDTRGYLGVGIGKASANKVAREKALNAAKLNMFPVKKGCGSWECNCGQGHSIPFTVHGKAGSVEVKLMPAPKGLGLCVSDEMKKVFEIAGIKDVRIKTRGKTHSRINFICAIEDALRNINKVKV
jgi:small subunit ribosomal protein S5